MKFKIHDTIIINELNIPGRIKRIQLEESGILYEVRYFWNTEAKSVWFYEDELQKDMNISCDVLLHKAGFNRPPNCGCRCDNEWHTMTQTEWMITHSVLVYPKFCPACGSF